MKTIGTPSNLEVLLHCHYSTDPHPRLRAPAVASAIKYLLFEEMITHTVLSEVYTTTSKGKAFVEHLMTIPFPEQNWVIPTGGSNE